MIKDIKDAGKYKIMCMISKCDQSKTNKGTPYLNMILEDASGVIDAKFWNLTEEQANQYKVGMVVEAMGDVILYRNALQFRVQRLIEHPEENITDYVRRAPMKANEMQREVHQYIVSMKDETLKLVTETIISRYQKDYYTYPAATRNHHNFVGGLAYHSLSMARLANHIAKQYPYLDRDLLISGTLLHDVGKIVEFSDPVLPEYTAQGNLLGHISIMNCCIDEVAHELGKENEESILLLKHMILSHHGKQEFGSPVSPMIPEAEVLSIIDDLDARLFMMRASQETTEPGKFGPRVFALEGRMVYRRKDDKE